LQNLDFDEHINIYTKLFDIARAYEIKKVDNRPQIFSFVRAMQRKQPVFENPDTRIAYIVNLYTKIGVNYIRKN
jgi:hypothetical protein